MKFLIPPMGREALEKLQKAAPEFEIVVADNHEEALQEITDADGAYSFVAPDLIKSGKKLRWVAVGSAGVEKYLFPELVESNIVLTNARGVYGIEVAEHTMALILSFSRVINILIRRQMEEIWEKSANLPVTEINGQTLGIIGLGGIGLEVAKRAHAFGMRILAVNFVKTQKPDYIEYLWRLDKLHEMLSESDFVAICCPLTKQTRNIIGEKEFKCMKPTAYLINIARGEIIDQDALISALRRKDIAGAGLDTTVPEPLTKGNPLWQMENVIITSHSAGQSPRARERLLDLLCENLRRFAANESLLNEVDKHLGY